MPYLKPRAETVPPEAVDASEESEPDEASEESALPESADESPAEAESSVASWRLAKPFAAATVSPVLEITAAIPSLVVVVWRRELESGLFSRSSPTTGTPSVRKPGNGAELVDFVTSAFNVTLGMARRTCVGCSTESSTEEASAVAASVSGSASVSWRRRKRMGP